MLPNLCGRMSSSSIGRRPATDVKNSRVELLTLYHAGMSAFAGDRSGKYAN
jgi:hypothetical protein